MSEDIYKIVGENIKRRRKEKGLTQQELAEKIDLSLNYVGLIERGDRHTGLDVLKRIADVLGIRLNALLEEIPAQKASDSKYTPVDKRILSLLRETPPSKKKAVITLLSSRSSKKR